MIPDFSAVIIQPYYRYTQLVIEIKIFQGDGDTRLTGLTGFRWSFRSEEGVVFAMEKS